MSSLYRKCERISITYSWDKPVIRADDGRGHRDHSLAAHTKVR